MVAFWADSRGIFPDSWLSRSIEAKIIDSQAAIPESNIQPASLDLRLGGEAFRLRCSFLPEREPVEAKLENLSMGKLNLRDSGAVLEQNRPYLIPLKERLNLPRDLRAKANPRSSTGRLDVFTRVITDRGHTFDNIRAGYSGQLYLEVVSRSFTIHVHEGLSLNQLRLIVADARVADEEIEATHKHDPLLFREGKRVPPSHLTVANGLFLSIGLSGETDDYVGYRAKKNSQLIDLSKVQYYEAEDFWEPVHSELGSRLILEPEEFYLLLSQEGVRVPPEFAAEMTAFDPTSGELRTHYAGFFDPGFGFSEARRQTGTRAALEVRAHDVPFMLEHGQRVCRLAFERMAERPVNLYGGEVGSTYQQQDQTLSKHFRSQVPPPDQLRLLKTPYNPSESRM